VLFDFFHGAAAMFIKPLSEQEIEQVAGAQNYVDPLPPAPVPPPVYTAPPGISPRFVES
jgi:hypothetical protein